MGEAVVGRIDYLKTNGKIGDNEYFADLNVLILAIKENIFYGVPMSWSVQDPADREVVIAAIDECYDY